MRESRHDRVTAGSQQSIKTQGDCLHLKDTKYHYNKHEKGHPSHCRLLFYQHYFALQTIILPEWFNLKRSKTEWTKETMKREEITIYEKEKKEDKRRNKQRTQIKINAENTTERPPNDPWFMSCQAQDTGPSLTTTWSAELPAPPHPCFIPNHEIKKTNVPPIQKRYVEEWPKGRFPCKQAASKQQASQPASQPASKQQAAANSSNSKQQASSSRQPAAGKQQHDFKKLIRLKPSTCMVIQEPNGNEWIWPTKASKTIQQINANLIGTATIATTPLKSFAQWYGLKSKESLRLWPLTVSLYSSWAL